MVAAVIGALKKCDAPCAAEFERVATSFVRISSPAPPPKAKMPTLSRSNSDGASSTNNESSTKKQLKAIASRLTSGTGKTPKLDAATDNRRATVHSISLHPTLHSQSQPSLQPPSNTSYDPSTISRSEPARSPVNMYSRPTSTTTGRPSAPPPPLKPKSTLSNVQRLPNLDYLSFGNEPENLTPPTTSANTRPPEPIKTEPGPTDWEKLLGSLDNGDTNIYDACYGGQPVEALMDVPTLGMSNLHGSHSTTAVHDSIAWTPDLWALCQTDTNTSISSSGLTPSGGTHTAGSIVSFSTDEGLSSCEEFISDWTSATSASGGSGNSTVDTHRAIVLPHGEDGTFSNWEASLNL